MFCTTKKPKAKAPPPSPPTAPPPSPPAAPPSQPPEEDVHAEEHQPCMGGDCDCIVELIEQMWRIPGMRSISVTNWANWGDHMDDHCYYDPYGPPVVGMPLPAPPSFQHPWNMAPVLPALRHGTFPPPPEYHHGLTEPPFAYDYHGY